MCVMNNIKNVYPSNFEVWLKVLPLEIHARVCVCYCGVCVRVCVRACEWGGAIGILL